MIFKIWKKIKMSLSSIKIYDNPQEPTASEMPWRRNFVVISYLPVF
jgi:hypothetical protein